MELSQLRYFQAVARTGNITRAARQLYITQPNLSKSISRLEEELGVPLFDHRKGKVVLNDYGRIFLASVDTILSELEIGTRAVQRMYEATEHMLSLASNLPGYLPDILPAFSRQNPDIGIRQRDATVEELLQHLQDRSISLAISNQVLKDPSIEFTQLSQTHYVVALSRAHPLAGRNILSLTDLAEESFICDNGRLHVEALTALCQAHGFTPKIGFEVQSTDLLRRLLVANHGPAIIPVTLGCQLKRDCEDGSICLLPLQEELPPVIIGIALRKDQPPTQAVQRFIRYLQDCIQEEIQLVQANTAAFKNVSQKE